MKCTLMDILERITDSSSAIPDTFTYKISTEKMTWIEHTTVSNSIRFTLIVKFLNVYITRFTPGIFLIKLVR